MESIDQNQLTSDGATSVSLGHPAFGSILRVGCVTGSALGLAAGFAQAAFYVSAKNQQESQATPSSNVVEDDEPG